MEVVFWGFFEGGASYDGSAAAEGEEGEQEGEGRGEGAQAGASVAASSSSKTSSYWDGIWSWNMVLPKMGSQKRAWTSSQARRMIRRPSRLEVVLEAPPGGAGWAERKGRAEAEETAREEGETLGRRRTDDGRSSSSLTTKTSYDSTCHTSPGG